jgi:cytochrome c biogenesis protein
MATKDHLRKNVLPADAAAEVRAVLAGRHYGVKAAEGDGRIFLLARKRALGWFGSDVVHIGLLVILAGGIVTGIGGFRTNLTLKEGETLEVPRAGFLLRLDKFETEYYPQGGVKDWKSSLTVLDGGTPALNGVVEVNHPLSYRGFSFYQTSYGWDWDHPRLELAVKKKSDAAFAKTLAFQVGEKAPVGDAAGTEVIVQSFLPDFVMGEGGRPESRSAEPNNPAALVEGWQGGEKVFSGWVFANYPDFGQMHGAKETDLAFELKRYDAAQVSVLEATRDPGVGFIWVGCVLVTAGFFLAFYWPPREIRAVIDAAQGKAEITAGGTAAKNREAFAAEFRGLMDELRRSK